MVYCLLQHFVASSDFENTISSVQFGSGEVISCYNQTIIDDTVPEIFETFDLVILMSSVIVVGNQSTLQITIIDDDIKGDCESLYINFTHCIF